LSTKPLTIAVVSWSNNLEIHNSHFALSFEAAPWHGFPEIRPYVILPHDKCRNLGEAYNLGRRRANEHPDGRPDIYLYMHQDVRLQDRSLGLKLRALLGNDTGIGAVGPLGATIDTGSGYWFCHPKYQVGSAGDLNPKMLLMVGQTRELKVLDGIFLATHLDMEWSEEYEGPHMFIEDMCMRVRAKGLKVWSVSAFFAHRGGGGTLDDGFWRSNEKFVRNWQHAFANEYPPYELFRAFMAQYRLEGGTVHRKIVEAGMYNIVWDTWMKKVADDRRLEKRALKEVAYG
jgi:hypothetical protein